MSKRDKGRLPPFLPLLFGTIDSPAWRAMSHGAKWLYAVLKRRSNSGPKAYVSYRDAMHELKAGRGKIREWFAELQHYGFIRQHSPGCLGVDGKGKSPHWRLTEKGVTSKANPEGIFEPAPCDFLKWDGTPFDPKPYRIRHGATAWNVVKLKKQNPSTHVRKTPVPTSGTPPVPTSGTSQEQTGTHVSSIERDVTGTHVGSISRLTTLRESPELSPIVSDAPFKDRETSKTKNGPEDELIAALGKWGKNAERRARQ